MILFRHILTVFIILIWGTSISAANHPCERLAENATLGEIWPDSFTSTMQGLAPKPRGTFQKTIDYEETENNRAKASVIGSDGNARCWDWGEP